jgi:RNA polymerase sigma factor (sigma-70 family)
MYLKIGEEEVLLVEGLRAGQNGSVERLYKRHYPAICRYVLRNQGGDDEAAEVYQQSFVILYEKLQDPLFELQSSVGTFLYAVARNIWLATLKERRRFVAETEDQAMVLPEADAEVLNSMLEREREMTAMEQSLDLLGEPCSTLLRYFYHASMSMEQIADQMGYTNADNAKSQKYKCLQRLKKIFEKTLSPSVAD